MNQNVRHYWHYLNNDTDLGTPEVMEIFFRNGDRLSNIKYEADRSTFYLYLPIFSEMFSTYEFAPASSPPVGVIPEYECLDADEVSVISCLPPDASLDPQAGKAISKLLDTQVCVTCM